MLERNRGARLTRTANIKNRGRWFIQRDIEDWQGPGARWEWYVDEHGKRKYGYHWLPTRPVTAEKMSEWNHYYLRHEGRYNLHNNKCGDCAVGSGKCDWCYGGTYHKVFRWNARLDDDLDYYDPDDEYCYNMMAHGSKWCQYCDDVVSATDVDLRYDTSDIQHYPFACLSI